ncbi:MAG: NACHT domain-containing protein [Spirulina sp. SIO3F2]|nr:NACHT domain-containing protein [Spirulina sp. SIO3F2]
MTVWQTLAIAAVSGIAVPVFQSILEGGGKVLDRFGKGINEQTRQLIFSASEQYTTNFTERHGTLKVLGMREPIELEAVYTTVQVLQDDGSQQFDSLADQEANFRQSNRRFTPSDVPTQAGLAIADTQPYLLVLGGPGSGKSTLLKRVGLEALQGKKGEFDHGCIPVFIELKRFNAGELSLEAFIGREFEISGFPEPENFTAKALEQGKFLLLLDGLDEVPSEQIHGIMEEIQDFVDRYAQNRFMISCRTGAIRGSFPRFIDVVIADFDDAQIEQFISNWFSSASDQEAETAERCWAELQKSQNAAAKELAHTPLLLTFLCRVFDRSQKFPTNRSVLYRKALRILLEEWASEKRIQLDEIYQGLHTEAEEILLSEIAYQGFQANHFFFSKRELVDPIKTFLTDNLNAPQGLDGESILNAIVVQQGIIVQRAEDVYSFSHLSLQEYLTAQYIIDNHLMTEVSQEHLSDPAWQEVFVLIAGLMRGGADDLLLAMEQRTLTLLNQTVSEIPRSLLQWASDITTEQAGKYEPTAKRAIAIALALALTPAQSLARALAPTLTKILIKALNSEASPQGLLELAQKLQNLEIFTPEPLQMLIAQLEKLDAEATDAAKLKQRCLQAFQIPAAVLEISDRDVQHLRTYLYNNQLMVRCKQAAVKVSPQTWAEIESRMLRLSSG